MKFTEYNLHPKVQKGLDALGFKRPTDIQYKAIPSILRGEDVLAVAQTGTGKTAAFGIPLVEMIYKKKLAETRQTGVKTIILAPTRELALQICSVIESIAQSTSAKAVAIVGGVDQDPQIKALEDRADIVIATPGRMFDLISQGHLKIHRVETLILDEADYMLDLGFINDIKELVSRLPKRQQTLFFSATINEKIKKIAYSIVKQSAIRIQISPKDPVAKTIEHFVMFMKMDHKRFFLERVVRENPDKKVLVFVRTKVRADRVVAAMTRVDVDSECIHGDKCQDQRTAILDRFRNGENMVLIATDITARGIDIPDVEIVVNYDLPEQAENYVHRVGRTGRSKQKGFAYAFCAEDEKVVLKKIQTFLHKDIQEIKVTKTDYKDTLNIERDRKNDYQSIIDDLESYNKKKKKKRK